MTVLKAFRCIENKIPVWDTCYEAFEIRGYVNH